MTKMTIYYVNSRADHLVSATAHIDLRYPLAGCIHPGRGIWQVIDLETGLFYGRPSDTLKECGPVIAKLYDEVQTIKRNPKNWDGWMEPRVRAVREMINEDNNVKLNNHLNKYGEVFNK